MSPTTPVVLLDTNIFISYLLTPERRGPITQIVEAAATGSITLVLPAELIDEFYEKITTKPYLVSRIDEDVARRFVEALAAIARMPESIDVPLPSIVRDPKDDYLIAHAVLNHVDYLITGDHDVLDLAARLHPLRIIQPADFVRDVLEIDQP